MAARRPLRVGLVGYGGIGRVHALGYRAIPLHYALDADAVRVAGVATSHAESAAAAARAGTNEPACANNTIRPVCRSTTLLPAILGPVIRYI